MLSDGCETASSFSGMSLSITLSDEAECRRVFDALAAAGAITMPIRFGRPDAGAGHGFRAMGTEPERRRRLPGTQRPRRGRGLPEIQRRENRHGHPGFPLLPHGPGRRSPAFIAISWLPWQASLPTTTTAAQQLVADPSAADAPKFVASFSWPRNPPLSSTPSFGTMSKPSWLAESPINALSPQPCVKS